MTAEATTGRRESLPLTFYPVEAHDWNSRPYFLWDLEMSWDHFRQCLHGPDDEIRLWALARLLNEADWRDVRRLISPADLAADLPGLAIKDKHFWEQLVVVAGGD